MKSRLAGIVVPLIAASVYLLPWPALAQADDIVLTICNESDVMLQGLFLAHGDRGRSVTESGNLAPHQCADVHRVDTGSNSLQYFQSGGPLCSSAIEVTHSQRFTIGPDTKASCIK